MVVNLEFIRAIVTAEEVLLLDPLCQEVLTFVDQLRQQLAHRSTSKHVADQMVSQDSEMLSPTETDEGSEGKLPFEFQVLEIALEIVCTYLDSSVAELERAVIVSIKNLEQVRSLKSNLTQLLSRVLKVRDEIEHLLDDNVNMTQLCLTRKLIQNQQYEALSGEEAPNSIISTASHSSRIGSVVSNYLNEKDVEDLEMLLEAYFVQLDGTRNKILSVREYIDDTEDYGKIRLDNQRNELIQLKLILAIASLAITVEIVMAGIFSLNIHCTLYHIHGIFGLTVGIMTASCVLLFIILIGYARWKKLLWS
ncbi:Magnesium transporter MRS2-4 [Forsythia ovata]|uniref:Magnesium transporter n=1 Tax=Forsythia ovata TaxID=205694 RepID=A0ABD1QMV1_9LAMI